MRILSILLLLVTLYAVFATQRTFYFIDKYDEAIYNICLTEEMVLRATGDEVLQTIQAILLDSPACDNFDPNDYQY